jgi:hypothetical protein
MTPARMVPRRVRSFAVVIALAAACSGTTPKEAGTGSAGVASGMGTATGAGSATARPPREFRRIAVVGASMSAGFGGRPLDEALRDAVPGATVTTAAAVWMFRDAVGNGTKQIDQVLADTPDLVVGIDFLFWHDYNGAGRDDRMARMERGLADLDRALAAGASVIVGDVPRIVTASELLIAKESIPPIDELAALNARLREWARTRPEVLVVPFAAMAEPLAAGADVEVAPGETMAARELMSLDGLHPNPLGVWYVMTKIDALVEAAFAVPAKAWMFARPAREPAPAPAPASAPAPAP